MPDYLYSATSPKGRTVTERIDAISTAAAREWLEDVGYRNIQFHTDDLSALLDRSTRSADAPTPKPSDVFSPKREKAARSGGGVWRELLAAFRNHWLPWLALLLWNLKTVYGGRPYTLMDWAGFVAVVAYGLLFAWMVVPAIAFQKMLEAGVWFRFEEQRRWINLIRLVKRFASVPIPAMELDFREATGFAAEGYLDHALSIVSAHDTPAVGKYIYYTRLSGLYEAAHRYDEMIELRRKAAEHGTGNPAERIDIALGLVARLRRTAEARAELAGLEPANCSDMIQYFHHYVLGLIAIEESDWKSARRELEVSLQKSADLGHNPLVTSMRTIIGANLGIALANLGEMDSARKLINKARPLMTARREKELLARCEAALSHV